MADHLASVQAPYRQRFHPNLSGSFSFYCSLPTLYLIMLNILSNSVCSIVPISFSLWLTYYAFFKRILLALLVRVQLQTQIKLKVVPLTDASAYIVPV